MKLTGTLPLLPLLSPLTHAAPKTRYSTVTVIPVPLSTTIIHYHPTGSSYFPSGSNRPGLHNAYHNSSANISLSYTLPYPTTTTLPRFPLIHPQVSAQPFISSNSTAAPGVPNNPYAPLVPLPCTWGGFYCHSETSFSLCAPEAGGGSRYVFMGEVAEGTMCEGGRIRKAAGGECSPVGNMRCHGERGFFLCNEGGLVDMGRASNETTCVDGELVASGSRRR